MAERINIGPAAPDDSSFRIRVAHLRAIIRRAGSDVLATSTDASPTAALAWAAWAESKMLVFPPTSQVEAIAAVAAARSLVTLSGDETSDDPIAGPLEMPAPDDIIAEFHTSGSTGQPVSFTKRGRQLVGEARFLADTFDITTKDVLLSGVPACHLYGFLFAVMLPAVSGCELITATPRYPESINAAAKAHRATVLVSTPTELRALAAGLNLPSVDRVFSSGAPLSTSVAAQLVERGMAVTEVFGSTETGGVAWRHGDPGGPWTPFEVADIDAHDGLLRVKSPFLDDPDAEFEMSDRIEPLSDGRFRHLGRADDIVKVGAKRVSKDALRRRFMEFDGVADVAIGQLDQGGAALHAFVTTVSSVAAADLRSHLLKWFDPVTVPRIHFVEALPRTALGKISHEAIRDLIRHSDREIRYGTVRRVDSGFVVPMYVPDDCRYFDGHYDGFPILPGVVQLLAIEKQIAARWPELDGPRRAERIKFHALIRPGTSLDLRLLRDDQVVSFRLVGDDELRCSGQFVYD